MTSLDDHDLGNPVYRAWLASVRADRLAKIERGEREPRFHVPEEMAAYRKFEQHQKARATGLGLAFAAVTLCALGLALKTAPAVNSGAPQTIQAGVMR